MSERNDPDPGGSPQPVPERDPSETMGEKAVEKTADTSAEKESVDAQKKRRRRKRRPAEAGLERIAEVHYCRTDDEANQYLALGPEWDLQDIVPMRVETDDGGERDEVHFIVARWENDRDRARLRQRDRRGIPRRSRD